jgi:hypothetical protein
MLICILALTFGSIYASISINTGKNLVKVCFKGATEPVCLPLEEAKIKVKSGLAVFGDCSGINTGKIIKCK